MVLEGTLGWSLWENDPNEAFEAWVDPARAQPFHRHRSLSPIPDRLRGSVVAIGNFDGLHRGHRALLDRALALAAGRNVPVMVLTFEPHPRTVFRPLSPVMRLTPASQRASLLKELGFDGVVEYPFNSEFAQFTPAEFVRSVLAEWLGVSEVVTGHDFHFGKAREGTPQYLLSAGAEYGFNVTLVEAYSGDCPEVISSTGIRNALSAGDVASAAVALGYRYTVRGNVLGSPVPSARRALMRLGNETPLAAGSYVVRFQTFAGEFADGVARVGALGAVGSNMPLLELLASGPASPGLAGVMAVSFFEKIDGPVDANDPRASLDQADALSVLDMSARGA